MIATNILLFSILLLLCGIIAILSMINRNIIKIALAYARYIDRKESE